MKKIILSSISLLLFASFPLSAQVKIGAVSQELRDIWNNPAVKQRIDSGIEHNRKGNFKISFEKPAENIKIRQLRHEFVFGAPTMMLGCFVDENNKPEETKNAKVEELIFKNLFNGATLSFLWKFYEPQEGKFRFEEGSEYIRYRPEPARILKICKKYDLVTRLHCLVWHSDEWHSPSWINPDEASYEKAMCAYIKAVGQRFGEQIDYVNVVNECSHLYRPEMRDIMPHDYVYKGFKEAEKHFPNNAKFCLNELSTAWDECINDRECSPTYLVAQNLLLRGAKLDEIGLQFHIFSEYDYAQMMKGKRFTPAYFFKPLDEFAKFSLPIQITEVTLPALPLGEIGESNQAFIAENLYRLWFSHAAVESITWWHTLDGTSKSEGKWMSGVLRYDFSKKPSYEVLERLINKEWRTNTDFDGKRSDISFRGFYGKYEISCSIDGKDLKFIINCSKRGAKNFKVSADGTLYGRGFTKKTD